MLRCVLLAAALTAAAPLALAQRNFPANALRGELFVTQPPQLLLNGKPARLAPGARIRDASNMLQLSGALVGQKLAVHYTREINGELLDVWVLTADEFRRQPWPVTPAQAAAWRFDPVGQRWSKP